MFNYEKRLGRCFSKFARKRCTVFHTAGTISHQPLIEVDRGGDVRVFQAICIMDTKERLFAQLHKRQGYVRVRTRTSSTDVRAALSANRSS